MKQKHTKYTQINTNKSAEQLVSVNCTQCTWGGCWVTGWRGPYIFL